MKYFFSQKKGFTLPELMTVISVMTIVGTLVYSSTDHRIEWREKVRNQETVLLNMFTEMRTMALSSSTVGVEGMGGVEIVPESGYGINFNANTNTFTVFADTNNGGVGDNEYSPTEDTILNSYTVDLYNNAFTISAELFSSSGVSNSLSSDESFTIFFYPPDADADIFDGENLEYQSLEIRFYWVDVLDEKIKFHKISRFFEKEQIYP